MFRHYTENMVSTPYIPAHFKASFRGSLRTLTKVLCAVVCTLGLAGSLTACGPDTSLRIEEEHVDNAPEAPPTSEAGPRDQPFSATQIRDELLQNPSVSNVKGFDEIHDIVLACESCMEMDPALVVLGDKFQMAKINTPADRKSFATVVIGEREGQPNIELILVGNELTVTPGRGGTLVAQESVFKPNDEPCCPSGWAVRVFRYHDGKFEAGQRISRLD